MKMIPILLIMTVLISTTSLASAYRIEQKIDIINAQITTTSTSYTPTSGTGGIIGINISAYDNVTEIYYEEMGQFIYTGVPNGGGSGQTRLYSNSNSTGLTESEVSLTGSSILKRSGNITYLFSNKTQNLSVQVKAGTDTTTIVYGARLVILQDGNITKTRTYIPLGESGSNNNGNATPLDEIPIPKRWIWNASDYGGNITVYFSGTWYRQSLAGNVYISLLDRTSASDITGTRMLHGGITPLYNTTKNITNLLTNGHELSAGWGEDGLLSNVVQRNAFLIIDQININTSNPIMTIPIQIENSQRVVNSTTATQNVTEGSQYNGTNWNGLKLNHTADYTYKSGNNDSGNSDLALAELLFGGVNIFAVDTQVNLSYTYRTKNFDFSNNQTDDNKISSAISNLGVGTTTSISSSRLIVKVRGLLGACDYFSGNWNVNCSDNCVITSNVNMPTKILYLNGEGNFTILANITVEELDKDIQCSLINKAQDNNRLAIKNG